MRDLRPIIGSAAAPPASTLIHHVPTHSSRARPQYSPAHGFRMRVGWPSIPANWRTARDLRPISISDAMLVATLTPSSSARASLPLSLRCGRRKRARSDIFAQIGAYHPPRAGPANGIIVRLISTELSSMQVSTDARVRRLLCARCAPVVRGDRIMLRVRIFLCTTPHSIDPDCRPQTESSPGQYRPSSHRCNCRPCLRMRAAVLR